ncbi:glycosyltransferase [Sodalis sp. RH15]|uniref:glycosyltransferase n=1 Tax=Sodalis sp. RH15 TaxID=3394330 RepID=UPI0039B62EB9
MNKKYAILIPTYNSSLSDILKTFSTLPRDANIFIIDDGSKISFRDETGNELNQYSNLVIIRSEENVGIENALNIGLVQIIKEYEYVARLDIGDISHIDRFETQVKYLNEHPDVVIVGTWAEFITQDGKFLFINKTPVDYRNISNQMFINNAFVHPSVMMRCSALYKAGLYSQSFQACEDYDLFFRLLKYGKGHNIPKVLLKYEVNYSSISSNKRRVQVYNRLKIIINNFEIYRRGIYPYYGILRASVFLLVGRKTTMFIRSLIRKQGK